MKTFNRLTDLYEIADELEEFGNERAADDLRMRLDFIISKINIKKVYYYKTNNDTYGNPRFVIIANISDLSQEELTKLGKAKRNSYNRIIKSYNLRADIENALNENIELVEVFI